MRNNKVAFASPSGSDDTSRSSSSAPEVDIELHSYGGTQTTSNGDAKTYFVVDPHMI